MTGLVSTQKSGFLTWAFAELGTTIGQSEIIGMPIMGCVLRRGEKSKPTHCAV
jgi:hypothetical protein